MRVSKQGPKLRLTGRQCDQKLGVGNQKFRTGRQQATNLSSHQHLTFQGKRAFSKRKHKAPVDSCSKTRRRFYDRHTDADIAGENMTWRDLARSKTWALLNPYFVNSDRPARWGTGLSNKKV